MTCCTSRNRKDGEESSKKYSCATINRPDHILQHYSNYYSNRYIFIPNNHSLTRYDAHSNQTRSYDLSIFYKTQFFTSQLIYSAYCLLPNGDIFIVSISNNRSLSFVYNLHYSRQTCFGPLNTVRDQMTLYYYRDYVYALGGYQTSETALYGVSAVSPGSSKALKVAERFKIAENKWEILSDMIEARVAPSVVGIGDSLYVLGGGGNAEKFDMITEKFVIVNFSVPCTHFITFLYEDSVYLLFREKVRICNQRLEVLEEKEIAGDVRTNLKLVPNLIIRDDQVFYYSFPYVIQYDISNNSCEMIFEITSGRLRNLNSMRSSV
jgi:hypothetical protein